MPRPPFISGKGRMVSELTIRVCSDDGESEGGDAEVVAAQGEDRAGRRGSSPRRRTRPRRSPTSAKTRYWRATGPFSGPGRRRCPAGGARAGRCTPPDERLRDSAGGDGGEQVEGEGRQHGDAALAGAGGVLTPMRARPARMMPTPTTIRPRGVAVHPAIGDVRRAVGADAVEAPLGRG